MRSNFFDLPFFVPLYMLKMFFVFAFCWKSVFFSSLDALFISFGALKIQGIKNIILGGEMRRATKSRHANVLSKLLGHT